MINYNVPNIFHFPHTSTLAKSVCPGVQLRGPKYHGGKNVFSIYFQIDRKPDVPEMLWESLKICWQSGSDSFHENLYISQPHLICPFFKIWPPIMVICNQHLLVLTQSIMKQKSYLKLIRVLPGQGLSEELVHPWQLVILRYKGTDPHLLQIARAPLNSTESWQFIPAEGLPVEVSVSKYFHKLGLWALILDTWDLPAAPCQHGHVQVMNASTE